MPVPLRPSLLPLVVTLAGCAADRPAAREEYRVFNVAEFYGLEAEVHPFEGEIDIWSRSVEVLNRWAAQGWEHVPGLLADGRIVLRRSVRAPRPHELRWVPQAELTAATSAELQTRLDTWRDEGWTVGDHNAVFVILRRPR